MALRQKFTQTKFFRALAVMTVLFLGIIIQPHFVMEPMRIVLATVARPIQGIFSPIAFGFQDIFHFLTSIGDLKRENDRLAQENIHLIAENSRWQSVSQENEELRKEVSLLPREKFQLRAVEVIGRDAAGLSNWLLVNQGSFQGIKPGMAVIVYGGVLIGRVAEVFPESARIMLLTNPESLVSGISIEGSAQGIVKGEYGLGVLFDMVPQNAPLQVADRVVTSGLGGSLPKDLVIGTLQEPHPSADHLYQRASVVSPVDFMSLRYLFIITNSFSS